MSMQELLVTVACTVAICLPALLWILRESRADMSSLVDDEDILY